MKAARSSTETLNWSFVAIAILAIYFKNDCWFLILSKWVMMRRKIISMLIGFAILLMMMGMQLVQ
jgi:hypothetical protein